MGCNLHQILYYNASASLRHGFRRNLTSFLPLLDQLARKTSVLWYVQPPVIDGKIKETRHIIDNKNVNLYNQIAVELLSRTRVLLWTSAREIAIDEMSSYDDDIHVGDNSSNYFMQIISNFWCNHRFSYLDGTCSKGRNNPYSFLNEFGSYFIVSQVSLVFVAAVLWKHSGGQCQQNEQSKLDLTTEEQTSCFMRVKAMFWVLTKLSFFLGYVFLCEKIPIFMKDPTNFSQLFVAASLIVSLFLVFYSCQKLNDDFSILKKQLIDETKGLVIVTLLFLKLSCSSRYQIIIPVRLTESALVALSGAEIFQHCWANQPMNFCHFFQELYRQNVLAVLLCLSLNHPFIQYEIFPLVLVCFSVTYLVLALPPRSMVVTLEGEEVPINAWSAIAVYFCKVVILVTVFGLLLNSVNMTEMVFSYGLWRSIFVTKEDTLDPWLSRWNTDKFCFLLGVLFGFAFEVCHLVRTIKILLCLKVKLLINGLIPIASILFLYKVYASFESDTSLQQIDSDYPVVFGYLAISYILFRCTIGQNCFYHSKVLAKLGRCWREIYLLHLHIWMAYDGNAFLVLLPFSSFINLCCVTFILLFLANDIHLSLL